MLEDKGDYAMNVLEKILEEIEHEAMTNKEIGRKQCEGMARAMNIIRSHMNHSGDDTEMGDWIPVEERLPDRLNKELYDINLVTLEDGEVCIGVYRDDKKEWWTRKKEGETLYTTKHNVIAWQPLPEPYKPNKDNLATEHIMSRFMKVE